MEAPARGDRMKRQTWQNLLKVAMVSLAGGAVAATLAILGASFLAMDPVAAWLGCGVGWLMFGATLAALQMLNRTKAEATHAA